MVLEKIIEIAGFKFVKATPMRVDTFSHDLDNTERNQEMGRFLSGSPSRLLKTTPEGELRIYDTAIIFHSKNSEFPVQFVYTFSKTTFNGHQGVAEFHLWVHPNLKKIKINGLPISAFSLFEVLIPTYSLVIGGEEHTLSGEKWSKRQIGEALKKGLHVYLTDEFGVVFECKSHNDLKKHENIMWGDTETHKKRRIIISKIKAI